MGNQHVATPFREIIKSIIRPVEYALPVAVDAQIQPETRFHADDITEALNVLVEYYGHPQTLSDWERLEDAFSRCMVALDAAMTRREEADLDAQFEYEKGRKPKVNVLEVLYDVREELDDREDTKDGDNGEPMPNWAMRLNRDVNAAIRALGGK